MLDVTVLERSLLDAAAGPGAPLGVVCVHALGLAHATATCSCGWSGRRRFLRAAAEQDAWLHAIAERCEVASPLVLTW